VIVTMAADSPLVREQETPLETDFIMSLRLLDSGTARDVSGIIRITQGESDMANENMAENIEERELLYFVGGDGSVKVFERGQ
jgi:elongator complex protein 6